MPIRRCSGSTQRRRPATAAADRDPPGVRALEAGDHPQQRRLARAARPEQCDELALADAQVAPSTARGAPNDLLNAGFEASIGSRSGSATRRIR